MTIPTAEMNILSVTNDKQASSNRLFVNQPLYKQFLAQNKQESPVYVTLKKSVFQLECDPTTDAGGFRISGVQRKFLKLSATMDRPELSLYKVPPVNMMLEKMSVDVICPTIKDKKVTVDQEILLNAFKKSYTAHFVSNGHQIFQVIEVPDFGPLQVIYIVQQMTYFNEKIGTKLSIACISDDTDVEFTSRTTGCRLKSMNAKGKDVFVKNFDFSQLDIGGLDNQLADIFRRAFSSRRMPQW